jgi:hypothetical protein
VVEEGATVVEAFQLSEALGKVTAAVQDATAAANRAADAAEATTRATRDVERTVEGFDRRLKKLERRVFGSEPPPDDDPELAAARPLDEVAPEAHARATGANLDLEAFRGEVIGHFGRIEKRMGIGRRGLRAVFTASNVKMMLTVIAALTGLAAAARGGSVAVDRADAHLRSAP